MKISKDSELSRVSIQNSKRESIRKPVDMDGFYNSGTGWHPCKIYDISTGGAALKLNQFFLEGDEILLRFGNNSSSEIFNTTVANVNGQRIGIRFKEDSTTKHLIEKIMSIY
ncbi:PilZ domain-containing protein [Spirochaeta isovalerica]|uniref:PilZ domain-containing protein n=1 Tax=Spirochaeta isovalerica TaxID=150 RepID=A0A841R8N8_9SPIO|nr:PilZ domain-containing protein [Spirochaeta isovalerica]MBB6481654.1 hypothetical protein [Spirochaeta isovalerica]